MIGRRGGTVVGDNVLKRLEPSLLKKRVVVSKSADRMLARRAASGIFRVFQDGIATIFLRSNDSLVGGHQVDPASVASGSCVSHLNKMTASLVRVKLPW